MPRSAFPQNYVISPGTLIEGFSNAASWNVTTDNDGTAVNDTSIYKVGSQSVKLSITNNGSDRYVYATKTGLSFKILPKNIYLWVYVHSDMGIVGQIKLYIGAVGSLTASYRATFPYNYQGVLSHSIVPRWNKLVMHRDMFENIGSPSWNNTQTTIRIRVDSITGTGQIASVSFGELGYDEATEARCIFTSDGARQTVYTRMYPVMAAAGIKGSCFITQNNVGMSGYYMDLTQLHALYAAGWSIGNHTVSHPSFTGLTQTQIEAEITPCTDYLLAQGFTKTAHYFAYPNGIVTANGLAAVANTGILASRTTYRGFCYGGSNLQTVTGYIISNGTAGQLLITLQNFQDIVDLAIRYGGTLFFYLDGVYRPDLGESPSDAFEQTDVFFQAMINYIVASRIKCVTMDEWYKGLMNPRYQSGILSRPDSVLRAAAGTRMAIL